MLRRSICEGAGRLAALPPACDHVSGRQRNPRVRDERRALDAVVGDRLPRPLARYARLAADATYAQRADQGTTISHATIVRNVGEHVGFARRLAARLGAVVDLLHCAVDLADNLADEAEDAAAGRSYAWAYSGIPDISLRLLPTLMITGALAELSAAGTTARRTASAIASVCDVLATMALGQGLPHGSKLRPRQVSGAFGALYALPCWLAGAKPSPSVAVETWGRALATLGHHRQALVEEPSASAARACRSSLRRVVKAWPRVGPFTGRGPLSVENVLDNASLRDRGPIP
jgi:hypothetical protein